MIPSQKARIATPHSLASFQAATPARIPKAKAAAMSTPKCHICADYGSKKLKPMSEQTPVTARQARKPITYGRNLDPRKHMSAPTPMKMAPVNGAIMAWYFARGRY